MVSFISRRKQQHFCYYNSLIFFIIAFFCNAQYPAEVHRIANLRGGGPASVVYKFSDDSEKEDFKTKVLQSVKNKDKSLSGLCNIEGINMTKFLDDDTVLYTLARQDRSGAAIQDMISAHAFAYMFRKPYGGVCGTAKNDQQYEELVTWQKERQALMSVSLFGVEEKDLNFTISDSIVPYHRECPRDDNSIVLKHRYYGVCNDAELFTDEWINYIRTQFRQQQAQSEQQRISSIDRKKPGSLIKIAVHVRRGDVDPCTKGHFFRYSPNSHFWRLIDNIISESKDEDNVEYDVTFYTESESMLESASSLLDHYPNNPTKNLKVSLKIDGDLATVWKGMVESDILILSKSTFSYVPAILNRGRVIYTPWMKGLPHWEIVDRKFLKQEKEDLKALVAQRCPGGISK